MLIGSVTALIWVPLAVSQDLPLWTEERRQKRREHEPPGVEAEPWEEEPFDDRAPPPILYV